MLTLQWWFSGQWLLNPTVTARLWKYKPTKIKNDDIMLL